MKTHRRKDTLRLITLRSRDQFNTPPSMPWMIATAGFGRRDVLFMNDSDLQRLGLEHGDVVDTGNGAARLYSQRLEGITVIAYNISSGSVGAYYPRPTCWVPLHYIDEESGTPSYKSVPVRVTLRSKEVREVKIA
ncbi:hypothetical protein M8494_10195 [Serratia ureilytica]